MKYLDDDIEVRFTLNNTEDQFTIYRVTIWNPSTLEFEDIYYGNIFLQAGQTTVDIYLNDIIKDYKDSYDWIRSTQFQSGTYRNKETFKVFLTFNDSELEEEVEVQMIYRYPTLRYEYELGNTRDTLLQGNLLPHYPAVRSNNFEIAFKMYNPWEAPLFVWNENTQQIFSYTPLEDASIGATINLTTIMGSVDKPMTVVKYDTQRPTLEYAVKLLATSLEAKDLSRLCQYEGLDVTTEQAAEIIATKGYIETFNRDVDAEDLMTLLLQDIQTEFPGETISLQIDAFEPNPTGTAMAILDNCPDDYYLMWVDRKGGIQCQGFSGKSKYSESFSNEYITRFKGSRKTVYTSVTPKWVINSTWINESDYPIYESIYVSPYVLLYDVKNDTTHEVIVTDTEYTEKTFRDEKKLISISLNVEKSKKQNIMQ